MRKKQSIRILFLLAIAMACGATARAQRYLPGMGGITFHAGITEKPGFYAEAGYSTYTRRKNRWNFGVNYLQNTDRYATGKLPLAQVTGEGGYYLRVFQDPRRTFFLSFGLSGIVGHEWVNWGKYRLPDGGVIADRNRFVFGGALGLEAEYYMNDRYVLLLRVREKCLGNSDVGLWHTEVGLGLKVIVR